MGINGKNKSELWKIPSGKPFWDGIIVTVILFSLSLITVLYFHQRVIKIHDAQLRSNLMHISQIASILINPETHKSFESPGQENSEEYKAVTEKFRQIQRKIPQIKYIYTTRLIDDQVRFVLDAALPGDADGDGVEDHSKIMDIYDEPDESLIKTLRSGAPHVSEKPYTDKWGTFISSSAPIHDRSNQLAGALAVDVDAAEFLRQKKIITRLSKLAAGIVLFISLIIGGIVYLLRRAGLRAEQERTRGGKL